MSIVYVKAKNHIKVSVGESVRILRELQGLTQSQLSRLTKIPQGTLSAIENDQISLGVERAKVLARALKCHPAILVFPNWQMKDRLIHFSKNRPGKRSFLRKFTVNGPFRS